MGDDSAVVQAARVSYGDGTKAVFDDRSLIRYLMRHRHTTPFEMCVTGDTKVALATTTGLQRRTVTIKTLAQAYSDGGFNSRRLRYMRFKSMGDDRRIRPAQIVHAGKTGREPVFELTTVGPLVRRIKATANHLFATPFGYRRLDELAPGDEVLCTGVDHPPVEDLRALWQQVPTIEEIACILDVGVSTVWKWLKDAGIPTYQHRPANPPSAVRTANRRAYAVEIASITPAGVEDVYDLQVASDNHNFVANGFIVHNCEFKFHIRIPMDAWRQMIRHRTASVNEVSTRYSEAINSMAKTQPSAWRLQSRNNKQGSNGFLPASGDFKVDGSYLTGMEEEYHCHSRYLYEMRLKAGVAREQARKDLPLSTYTEAYWKIDLHNLLHYLELRLASEAQLEIRQYAQAIAQLIKPKVPITWEAFEDYRLNAFSMSNLDAKVVSLILTGSTFDEAARAVRWGDRERNEGRAKLSKLGFAV
jgi:thymidylate synthase (FAD)